MEQLTQKKKKKGPKRSRVDKNGRNGQFKHQRHDKESASTELTGNPVILMILLLFFAHVFMKKGSTKGSTKKIITYFDQNKTQVTRTQLQRQQLTL